MNWLANNRIRLRAPEPEDLEILYRWENDSSLWPSGNTVTPYSKYQLRQFMETSAHDIYQDRQIRFMIEWPERQSVVGAIDLFDFDPYNNRAEVGIIIDLAYQQSGIGSEALSLLENYAFGLLHLRQLYAYVIEPNRAANRLFSKAGFTPTAILNDWCKTASGYTNAILFQKIDPQL